MPTRRANRVCSPRRRTSCFLSRDFNRRACGCAGARPVHCAFHAFGCAVNGGAGTSAGHLYVDYLLKPNAAAAVTETVSINVNGSDNVIDGTMPGTPLAPGLYATDGALDPDSIGWAIARQ